MGSADDLLQQIEEEATSEQRTYPGGVGHFSQLVRGGPVQARQFIMGLGQRLFSQAGINRLDGFFRNDIPTVDGGWVAPVRRIAWLCAESRDRLLVAMVQDASRCNAEIAQEVEATLRLFLPRENPQTLPPSSPQQNQGSWFPPSGGVRPRRTRIP